MLYIEPPTDLEEEPIPPARIVASLDYLRRLARMIQALDELSGRRPAPDNEKARRGR